MLRPLFGVSFMRPEKRLEAWELQSGRGLKGNVGLDLQWIWSLERREDERTEEGFWRGTAVTKGLNEALAQAVGKLGTW